MIGLQAQRTGTTSAGAVNMPKRKVQLNAGDLILNSPFREPSRYWSYDRKHRIVPTGLYNKLRQAKVLVHNWHSLGWETEEQISQRRSVDKRGLKSDEAWVLQTTCEQVRVP